eukprot:1161469-Pelagomonas_calceolata.AAC.24
MHLIGTTLFSCIAANTKLQIPANVECLHKNLCSHLLWNAFSPSPCSQQEATGFGVVPVCSGACGAHRTHLKTAWGPCAAGGRGRQWTAVTDTAGGSHGGTVCVHACV